MNRPLPKRLGYTQIDEGIYTKTLTIYQGSGVAYREVQAEIHRLPHPQSSKRSVWCPVLDGVSTGLLFETMGGASRYIAALMQVEWAKASAVWTMEPTRGGGPP